MLCCAAAASRVASGTIRSQPPPSGPPGPTATAAGRLYTVLVAQRCENGRHGLSTALRWPPAGPAALADHPQRPTCNAGGPRRRGAVLYVRRRRCLPRMVEIEASVPSHHPAERFATAPRGDAHKCARRGRPLRAKWSATSMLRRGRSNRSVSSLAIWPRSRDAPRSRRRRAASGTLSGLGSRPRGRSRRASCLCPP